MRTETATKKITQSGDSLVINVTKEAHRLGLARGDDVVVTLAPVSDDLDFMSRCMNNIFESMPDTLTRDENGLIHGATRRLADRFYMSLADCSPPGYIIAMDPTPADRVLIAVFKEDSEGDPPVLYWIFLTED